MKKFSQKKIPIKEAQQIQGTHHLHHTCKDRHASYSVTYPVSLGSGECNDWNWACNQHIPPKMKYVASHGDMKWKPIIGFYWHLHCRYADDDFDCSGSFIWC